MNYKVASILPLSLALAAIGFAVDGNNAKTSATARRGPVDESALSGLVWRNIGPFRGGRVSAVSGAIGEPGVFYVGLPAGGIWKTTSAGETWYPVFDSIKEVSSI